MKAVIWTDVFQSIFMLGGVITIIVLVSAHDPFTLQFLEKLLSAFRTLLAITWEYRSIFQNI